MSRCFKHYDVKHLRRGGCVPATRETGEGCPPPADCQSKIIDNGSIF